MPQDSRSRMMIRRLMKEHGISYEAAYQMVASGKSEMSDQERALSALGSQQDSVINKPFARLGASEGIDKPYEVDVPGKPGTYRDPSGTIRKAPTPVDHDPTADAESLEPESVEPIPVRPPYKKDGTVTDSASIGESVVRKEDGGFRGLVNTLVRKNDPEIKPDAPYLSDREKELKRREKTRRDAVREGKEYVNEGITLNGVPIKVDGSKKGLYHDRIREQQAIADKDRRMSAYLEEEGFYNPDGTLNESKLAGADYEVRAWVETKKVLSGDGITGPGKSGNAHTRWGLGESKRHERLVKHAHFNTGGSVVPHPTREGQFIIVSNSGRRVHDLGGFRAGKSHLEMAESLEANKERIARQPQRYDDAFKRADDRNRIIESRKQGSVQAQVAMELDLPHDHPAVLREADRRTTGGLGSMPRGRYWQGRADSPGAIVGPSSLDAYTAAYYSTEDEGQKGRGGTPARPSHWSKSPTGRQAVVVKGYERAQAEMSAATSAWEDDGSPPPTSAKGKVHAKRLSAAKRKLNRATSMLANVERFGPGAAPVIQTGREDLRGKDMTGHFSRKMRSPISRTRDPWSQMPGVRKTRRLQDEWEDWLVSSADERTRGAIDKVNDLARSEVTGRTEPEAEPEAEVEPISPPRPGTLDEGPEAGMSKFEDKFPVLSPESSLDEYSPGPIAKDPKPIAPRRPAEDRPTASSIGPEYEDTMEDFEEFENNPPEPYQPTVKPNGETGYEPVDFATYIADSRFDRAYGDQLMAIRERLDSTDINTRDTESWWRDVTDTIGITEPTNQAKMWFDTFMSMATKTIDPDKKMNQRELQAMIVRWGDRHISSYSKTIDKERSVLWTSVSPTLTRGRRPDITGPEEEKNFPTSFVEVDWEGVGSIF